MNINFVKSLIITITSFLFLTSTVNADIVVNNFGSPLFESNLSSERTDLVEPTYKIQTGDKIQVKTWGSLDHEVELVVDGKGNIFLTPIGPIKVIGLNPKELNDVLSRKIKKYYTSSVNVYAQVNAVQLISVNVLGYVEKPTRYSGKSSTSVLQYLNLAGGIKNGTYRKVDLIRDNKILMSVDLYEMITLGKAVDFVFKNNDTIRVSKEDRQIIFKEGLDNYKLDIVSNEAKGSDVVKYLKNPMNYTHVISSKANGANLESMYITMKEFESLELKHGDQYEFVSDRLASDITVGIQGSYIGRSKYVVSQKTYLKDLLDNVEVDPALAQTDSISIYRKSIAKAQKKSLNDALDRLESTFMKATSETNEEASIRAKEAELIADFVKRAKTVEPDGRLVVSRNDEIQNVLLQDGDIIEIPKVSSEVLVSGEVLMPMAIVHTKGDGLSEYLHRSGGLTENADEKKILLIKRSGESILYSGQNIDPGDQILVLPKAPEKNIQMATSISQILYQIAVAAKVVLDL